MKKVQKFLLILAACMAGLGVLFTAWGIWWSMKVADRLTPEETTQMSFPIDLKTISDITIDLGVGDVQFETAETAHIDTAGFTKEDITIEQIGNTLSVVGRSTVGGSHILNFGFFRIDWLGRLHIGALESKIMTVYLPEGTELESFTLDTDVGDIRGALPFRTQNISIHSRTGDITLQNVNAAENASVSCVTGDLDLQNVSAGQVVDIHSTTGDHKLQDIECNRLLCKQTTGDLQMQNGNVTGACTFDRGTGDAVIKESKLRNMQYDVTTGNLKFDGITTGTCDFKVTTGDLILDIDAASEHYRAELSQVTGDTDIQNAPITLIEDDHYAVHPDAAVPNILVIRVTTGDIQLIFDAA